jgi:two-component system sensor histidine kinase DegS
MSETANGRDATTDGQDRSSLRGSTIRRQLILASLFPLAFFSLLSILVISVALYQVTFRLALQGNMTEARAAADDLADIASGQPFSASSDIHSILLSLNVENGSRLYVVDEHGELLSSSIPELKSLPLSSDALQVFIREGKPASRLMVSSNSGDEAIISFSPLPAGNGGVILEEPWTAILAPASYYQLVLAGLMALGTILSLYMLSLSIGRVIRPIVELANSAIRAVPGSVFHPMPEQGPVELQNLIKAFNQMVIRLAEQQGTLRQYAHKALLSQEEERQRLSHELHDGTVQDLVGLAQRVELCRSEMERDPELARRRLDELQGLVEQTLSDVRRISNALRPSILEDLGLSVALQALCSDLEKQLPPVSCGFTVSGGQRRLPPDVELAVFRVVQEALVNIRKHVPNVSRVQVELTFREEDIQAVIHNDGSAFPDLDMRSLVRTGHLGLAGMYERARLFHGELDVFADPGGGTTIKLRLPLAVTA